MQKYILFPFSSLALSASNYFKKTAFFKNELFPTNAYKTASSTDESTFQSEPARFFRKRVNPMFKPAVMPSDDVKAHTFGLFSGDGSLDAFKSSQKKAKQDYGPSSAISYQMRVRLADLPLNRALLNSIRRDWGGIGTVKPYKQRRFSEVRNVWEWYYGYYWQVSNMNHLYFFLKAYIDSPLIGLSWRNHLRVVRILSSMEQALFWGSYLVLCALEEGGVWAWVRPKPVRLVAVMFGFSSLWCFDGILSIPWGDQSYSFYLVGFVEAEGHFHGRILLESGGFGATNRRFAIGQADDRLVIESIRSFFFMTESNVQTASCLNYPNCFFVIESGDLWVNLRIVKFFNNYPFLGDKIRSFRKFEADVLMSVRKSKEGS